MRRIFIGKKLKCPVPRTSPDFVVSEVVSIQNCHNGLLVHLFNPKSKHGWCFVSTGLCPFGQWVEIEDAKS